MWTGCIETQAHSHTTFFKLLKQEHPEIVTVAMTSASDSEVVIDLINQARIYRLLPKPVNLSVLRQALASALERFAQLAAAPALAGTERPKESVAS